MKEKVESIIRDLALLHGLSGHEQEVSNYISSKFNSFGLDSTVDTLGNTITHIKGTGKGKKILLTAHMDQLGFVVKYITPNGFIKVERLGGLPEKTLSSLRVAVKSDNGTYVNGIIGVKSHHITPPEEKYVVDKWQDLFIDIGCNSREEVFELGINVGNPIVYRPHFEKLQNDRVSGTSFDNRVACAMIVELAERFAKNPAISDVYLAGTVQEEYTIRGAILAARAVNPDVVICLDLALDGSTPDLENTNHVTMGQGPAISLYSFHGRGTLNGTIPHPALVKHFTETSKKYDINLQRTTLFGGLTELSYMQLEGGGIAGIDVGIPCRYTHTQIETIDLSDVVKGLDLVEKAVRDIDSNIKIERK